MLIDINSDFLSEKYGIEFLNLKDIIKENKELIIKIIHVQKSEITEVGKILKLPIQKQYISERVDLHYVGIKPNGRAMLARCNGMKKDSCDLCLSSNDGIKKVFSKHFFYGVFNNQLVYFSITNKTLFQIMTQVAKYSQENGINPADLYNPVCISFIPAEDKKSIYKFNRILIDKDYKLDGNIIDKIKLLPILKSFLEEKYPECWPDYIKKKI